VVGYVQAHRDSSACQRHRAVVLAISDVNLPRGVDCDRQRCIETLRELSEHATIKNHSAARNLLDFTSFLEEPWATS
jgi:hypothetical protein